MDFVNRHLSEDNDALMFATAFCAVLNIKKGDLVYTTAGHNPPVIVSLVRETFFLEPTGSTALGIDSDSQFSELTVKLHPNETLLMYTDGITKALNQQGELFSDEHLLALASEIASNPVEEVVVNIIKHGYDGQVLIKSCHLIGIKSLVFSLFENEHRTSNVQH